MRINKTLSTRQPFTLARIGALLLVLLMSLPVLAMGLDEAKSRLDEVKREGYVGEKPTGYLGVVKAGEQAQAIVDAINEARRNEYERIADKHGVEVTKVEAVAGKKALEKTPPGEYIWVDGQWQQK
ncbi:YdbL family protein [Marinobacteraceae bacterium S3BR75-40.1]